MKKLIFVMVGAFGLMFVSCNSNPTSNSSEASIGNAPEVTSVEATSAIEEISEEVSKETVGHPAAVKPGKPEVKEDVDVTTPAKPTEEVNKPVGEKK